MKIIIVDYPDCFFEISFFHVDTDKVEPCTFVIVTLGYYINQINLHIHFPVCQN